MAVRIIKENSEDLVTKAIHRGKSFYKYTLEKLSNIDIFSSIPILDGLKEIVELMNEIAEISENPDGDYEFGYDTTLKDKISTMEIMIDHLSNKWKSL